MRSELLDAAADLMAQHGSIDKVSIRAVAAAAGVSATAVYRHFESHTDLLWAAVQHSADEFAGRMAEAAASTDDPYDRLHASGMAYVRFALEEPGKYRVMFSNRVTLPAREEAVGLATFDQLVGQIGEILDQAGDDRDPQFVAVQVWTWIHGIVDLMGTHRGLSIWPAVDDLLEELRDRLHLGPPDS